MEQSLSLRGLKWRLEAIRTGRSFSEVVLLHSLVFRVEQIFLIHKKTGLPLAHAVAPAAAMQDPSLVSGMLTAIQDFVRDSFHAGPGENVEKLNVGELEVWIESGPYASIAAVIRGVPPPELRMELAETLEEIHVKFGALLEGFQGNTAPFARVTDLLSRHLDARYKEKERVRPKPYTLVFASVLLVALLSWLAVRWWQDRQWSRFVTTLQSEPGIVVTSSARQNGHFAVQGLRDPLATDPQTLLQAAGIDSNEAEFHWNGYYALDDAIVQKRAAVLLKPPPSATLDVRDGVLRPGGQAPRTWIESTRLQAPLIPGIRSVDLSRLIDADEAAFKGLKGSIESTVVRFPVGSAELSAADLDSLKNLVPRIDELMRRSAVLRRGLVVSVVGHSDSTGPEATNRPLSQSRADVVQRQLARQGVDERRMKAKGVASSEPLRSEENEEARQYNRSVTFRILPVDSPPL